LKTGKARKPVTIKTRGERDRDRGADDLLQRTFWRL